MNDLSPTLTYGTRELRTNLRNVMDHTIRGGHTEITRHTKAEAYIVPAEWYHDACAALSALNDADGA